MSIELEANASIQSGAIGGSISDGILDLSLSVPVHPTVSIGGSVFIDLNKGGSIIGGSFDISILKYFKIEIGRKGCTEYITISIGMSPSKNTDSGNGKGRGSNKGNSRDNGKNNHGSRTNRNNRNRDKPPIRLGDKTQIEDNNTKPRLDDINRNDSRGKSDNNRDIDLNKNLQDTVRNRIRDTPRE